MKFRQHPAHQAPTIPEEKLEGLMGSTLVRQLFKFASTFAGCGISTVESDGAPVLSVQMPIAAIPYFEELLGVDDYVSPFMSVLRGSDATALIIYPPVALDDIDVNDPEQAPVAQQRIELLVHLFEVVKLREDTMYDENPKYLQLTDEQEADLVTRQAEFGAKIIAAREAQAQAVKAAQEALAAQAAGSNPSEGQQPVANDEESQQLDASNQEQSQQAETEAADEIEATGDAGLTAAAPAVQDEVAPVAAETETAELSSDVTAQGTQLQAEGGDVVAPASTVAPVTNADVEAEAPTETDLPSDTSEVAAEPAVEVEPAPALEEPTDVGSTQNDGSTPTLPVEAPADVATSTLGTDVVVDEQIVQPPVAPNPVP